MSDAAAFTTTTTTTTSSSSSSSSSAAPPESTKTVLTARLEHRPEEHATKKPFEPFPLRVSPEASEERRKLAEQVSELAKIELFLWDHFPIQLPPSTLLSDYAPLASSGAAADEDDTRLSRRERRRQRKNKKKLDPSLVESVQLSSGPIEESGVNVLSLSCAPEYERSDSSSSSRSDESGMPPKTEPTPTSLLIEDEIHEETGLVPVSSSDGFEYDDDDLSSSDGESDSYANQYPEMVSAGYQYGNNKMMGLSTEEVHDQENALGKLSSKQKQQLRRTGAFEVQSVKFPDLYHKWKLSLLLQKGTENIKEDSIDNWAGMTGSLLHIPRSLSSMAKHLKDAVANTAVRLTGLVLGNRETCEPQKYLLESRHFSDFLLGPYSKAVDEIRKKHAQYRADNQDAYYYGLMSLFSTAREFQDIFEIHLNSDVVVDLDDANAPPPPLFIDIRLFRHQFLSEYFQQCTNNVLTSWNVDKFNIVRAEIESIVQFSDQPTPAPSSSSSSSSSSLEDSSGRNSMESIMDHKMRYGNLPDWTSEWYDLGKTTEQKMIVHGREIDGTVLLVLQSRLARIWVEKVIEEIEIADYKRHRPSLSTCTDPVDPRPILAAAVKVQHIFNEVDQMVNRKRSEFISAAEKKLKEDHDILFRIHTWRYEKIAAITKTWDADSTNLKMKEVLKALRLEINYDSEFLGDDHPRVAHLKQWLFILHRTWQWEDKLREPVKSFLDTQRVPARPVTFRNKIWDEKKWEIKMYRDGRYYVHDTYSTVTISTHHLGWRLKLPFPRTWNYINNSLYAGWKHLKESRMSLRTFLNIEPYYPKLRINEHSGTFETDPHYKVPTYYSRLRGIWRNIRRSRSKFESQPEYGLLGKSVSRFFNIVNNYLIKGLIGTTSVAILFPIVALVNTLFTILGTLICVVPAPIWSLLAYVRDIFIHDRYNRDPKAFTNLPIFLTLGACLGNLIKAVWSLGRAVIWHPLMAILALLGLVIRSTLRYTYDTLVFYLVLRSKSRVPIQDTFLARRVAGPGLSFQLYQRMSHSDALTALQYDLEIIELGLFEERTSFWISLPRRVWKSFFKDINSSFVKKANTNFSLVDEQDNKLRSTLNKRTQERRQQIEKLLPKSTDNYRYLSYGSGSIRQTVEEHLKTIDIGNNMVKEFVLNRVYPTLDDDPVKINKWWADNDLPKGDFIGLTRTIFSRRFTSSFLEPLRPEDVSVELKVDHTLQVRSFAKMISSDNIRDDLDLVSLQFTSGSQMANVNQSLYYPSFFDSQFTSISAASLLETQLSELDKDHTKILTKLQAACPV